MGSLILIHPGIKVKSIKSDTATADRDFDEKRTHLRIEAIAIHPEIARRVTVADEARHNGHWGVLLTTHSRRRAHSLWPDELRLRSNGRCPSMSKMLASVLGSATPHGQNETHGWLVFAFNSRAGIHTYRHSRHRIPKAERVKTKALMPGDGS